MQWLAGGANQPPTGVEVAMSRSRVKLGVAIALACGVGVLTAQSQGVPRGQPAPPASVAAASAALCAVKPGEHRAGDARAAAAKVARNDGVHVVARSKTGVQLLAVARGGKIIDYVVAGRSGSGLASLTLTTAGNAKDDCNPCCWKCGKDEGGTVHCWLIECPIMAPSAGGGG